MSEPRKILVSPGFGAGWSTWMYEREQQEFALFYGPLIEAVESQSDTKFEAALAQFKAEFKEKFGDEPYCGGARELEVETVNGEFSVEEYDGSESLRYRDSGDWF